MKQVILILSFILPLFPLAVMVMNESIDRTRKCRHRHLRILVYTLLWTVGCSVYLFRYGNTVNSIFAGSWFTALFGRLPTGPWTFFRPFLQAVFINSVIGIGYSAVLAMVRIGLNHPKLVWNDGKISDGDGRSAKIEKNILRFFHSETWYLVGRILASAAVILTAAYSLVSLLCGIYAIFGKTWLPQALLETVMNNGYHYPILTILPIVDFVLFLRGVQAIDEEQEDLSAGKNAASKPLDLEKLAADCRKENEESHLAALTVPAGKMDSAEAEEPTADSTESEWIHRAVKNDSRNPGHTLRLYAGMMNKLLTEKDHYIINGSIYSTFSAYFMRYLEMILTEGETVLFLCSDENEVETVYSFLVQGLSEIVSLYEKELPDDKSVREKAKDGVSYGADRTFEAAKRNYDDPIWRIRKMGTEQGVHLLDDCAVFVATPDYLCSGSFSFINASYTLSLSLIIMTDTARLLSLHSARLAMIHTQLQNELRHSRKRMRNGKMNQSFLKRPMKAPVRYIGFDNSEIPGLDKVLRNLFSLDFKTMDCTLYSGDAFINCYAFEETDPGFSGTEQLGRMMEMAAFCRLQGAERISAYPGSRYPWNPVLESAEANAVQLHLSDGNSRVETDRNPYNADTYQVILIMDDNNNLPDAVRKAAQLSAGKPLMINVISKSYILRDYYADQLDKLWRNEQITRIPVGEDKKMSDQLMLLVKANSGGVSTEEILRVAQSSPELADFAAGNKINSIMMTILSRFGISKAEASDFSIFFEAEDIHDFDENGIYQSDQVVRIRQQGKLYDCLSGRNMAALSVGGRKIPLLLPKERISQNYIAGQNISVAHDLYTIQSIADEIIHAKITDYGSNTEAYEYRQNRNYYVERRKAELQVPDRHWEFAAGDESVNIRQIDISEYRAPMKVETEGYLVLDARESSLTSPNNWYRRLDKAEVREYGNPADGSDSPVLSAENGALILEIRMYGKLPADCDRTVFLLSFMMNEIFRTMFPTIYDSSAVLPVLKDPAFPTEKESDTFRRIQPKLNLIDVDGSAAENEMSLLIVEDCPLNLGLISTLTSSGNNVFFEIFGIIHRYLEWYRTADKAKTGYLRLGKEDEPSCFDFETLYRLTLQLSGETGMNHADDT